MNEHPQSSIVLYFDNVSFSYGHARVLEQVSFHIHEGEFTALVGANGAGKTTILKLILGLEQPESGIIALFGNKPHQARSKIGYVPQHAGYDPAFPISVGEVIHMGRLDVHKKRTTNEDREAVAWAMEQSGIQDLEKRPYSALSGGQRRRVLVARALAARPELLILDEPTSNMDKESERRLFETLGRLKAHTTILIVTHDTSFVSSLTDAVLCVGDQSQGSGTHAVIRHQIEPLRDAPSSLFGGQAVKVLHDTDLNDACCCGKENV